MTDKDKEIIEKVQTFGLFNGKDEVEVYAHFIPDAIDPDDKLCQDGEGTRLYFELFTDAILRSIIDDDSFVYEYGVVLECDSRSLDILHEYMFPQDYYDQKELENDIFRDAVRHQDRMCDVVLKLRPKTDDSRNICLAEFHAPISVEGRKNCDVPFYETCEFEIYGTLNLSLVTEIGDYSEPNASEKFARIQNILSNKEAFQELYYRYDVEEGKLLRDDQE